MRWLVFLIGIVFWSCAPENKSKEKSAVFYDINGLIDEQVSLLSTISPSVSKRAMIGGQEEITTFTLKDSTSWANELAIFKSADINQSKLVDSYTSKSSTDHSLITYTSKYPENTAVESLSIHFEKDDQKPSKIHAFLNTSNELFTSGKSLEMHFKQVDGKPMLFQYIIEGRQQMISMDSTNYLIKAEIMLP